MRNHETHNALGLIAPALDHVAELIAQIKHEALSAEGVIQACFFDPADGSLLETDPTEYFLKALSTWDAADSSENGSVVRFPGLVEVSPALFSLLPTLNKAKQSLEAAVMQLELAGTSRSQMRNAYRQSGHPRIHPLQAWRQVVCLAGNLTSIGFTVSKKGSGSELIRLDEALTRLCNANAFDLAEMIRSESEDTIIRWHEPVSRHIRANVAWGAGAEAVRKQFHASMPICVPTGAWPTKRVRFNEPKEDREHKVRSDRIEGKSIRLPFREGAYFQVA